MKPERLSLASRPSRRRKGNDARATDAQAVPIANSESTMKLVKNRATGERRSVAATSASDVAAPAHSAPSRLGIRCAVVGIILIGTAAFLNSFAGLFVFDDVQEIENNRRLLVLMPPWKSMLGGNGLPPRPLPYYTFAIDRAIWGTNPFGYHFANLALHLSSALLIFDIVRRTFLRPALIEQYRRFATTIAFFSAALWVCHPLHTQAVTYVYQRIELMMAFFVLLSFDCFLHSIDSAWPKRLLLISVGAMFAAVFCKESAIALPPMVFLYDVIFVTGSWKETVGRRAKYYIALFAAYVPLGALVLYQSSSYIEFREPKSGLDYALNQPIVLLHYLRLSFFPSEQNLYSLRPWTKDWNLIAGPLAIEVICLAISAYGIIKKRPWGFLCAAFFIPLFPTSSVIPVKDLVMEHRMYVSLVALTVATTLLGVRLFRYVEERTGRARIVRGSLLVLAAAAIAGLSVATHERNRMYYDRVTMWDDVVRKSPHNHYALENLAVAYLQKNEYELAAKYAAEAVALYNERALSHLTLGTALLSLDQRELALKHLKRAVELGPNISTHYVNLGVAIRPIDPEASAQLYAYAYSINPYDVEAMANLAFVHARALDFDEAEKLLRKAIDISPDDPRLRKQLNFVLEDKKNAE